MGWTSKMRANRFSQNFKHNGEYRGNKWNARITEETEFSEDTKMRMEILKEISKRTEAGENVDNIVDEISKRENVKNQFSYYAKNGITDLAAIIRNWYESYKKNFSKKNNMKIR